MDELTQLMHQGGIGVIFVYILQYLKKSTHFPWITQDTAKLNRWLAMLVALGTSLGIKYAATAAATGGGWHVVLDIPSLASIGDSLIHAAAQYAGQVVLYNTSVKDTIGAQSLPTSPVTGELVPATVIVHVPGPDEQAAQATKPVAKVVLPAMPPHTGLGGQG